VKREDAEQRVDVELNDDQRMLQDLVGRFVADRYALGSRARYRADDQGFWTENWLILGELGLLGLTVSVDDGGAGFGNSELVTVMETFGRGLVVEPYLNDIVLAGTLLARCANIEQREQWLPSWLAGSKRIVLAHLEHGARFRLEQVSTRALSHAGATRLAGTKSLVPSAVGAAAYLVTARESSAQGSIGLYLVHSTAPGITLRNFRLVDGSVASEIVFADTPVMNRLDFTLAALHEAADAARLAACAEMVGTMATLLDTTLDYVRARRQFGVAIRSFQVVQHRLTDCFIALEQSRSQLLRAAVATPAGRAAAVAGAKSFIAERAIHVGEECIQFHGAMGVSDETIVGHGHKRLMVLATWLGDARVELLRYIKLTAAS